MKWLFVLVVLFVGVFYFKDYVSSPQPQPLSTPITPAISQKPTNILSLSYYLHDYHFIYEKISGKNLILIPNFTEKRSASAIAEEKGCTIASSGGFYTKNNKPLGLFQVDGKEIGKRSDNTSLLTGFLFTTRNHDIGISEEPRVDAASILQAGPLFETGNYFPTKTDEYARRIVVVEDTNGNEYLGAVFDNGNSFVGPQLSDLPAILFSIKSPFRVNRVLNLDGGNASFFKDSNGFTLSEIVAVGSIICIK